MQEKHCPNENNIDTKDPGDDRCGRQKRPAYVKKNLHTWKETCSKKTYPKWQQHDTKDPGEDACGRQKRPTYMKTDQHTRKETCSKYI